MSDWWKSLTQDNKVKIFLAILTPLAALIVGINWFGDPDDNCCGLQR